MKYLSTNRLTLVTLQDRQGASLFVIPPELAALITWFLASPLARLVALMVWCMARRLVVEFGKFCHHLAATPDRIREAALDFLLGGLVYAT